jgi:hypothetical protein
MPAIELLCRVMGVSPNKLSREENFLLEMDIFMRVCRELKEVFKSNYKNYFCLMKLNAETEDAMLEAGLMRYIITDILLTEEYSLNGIAYYTQTPEDIICDVVTGRNTAPSLPLSRKIIELHRSVRPNLYREIIKKITSEYLTQE